MEIRKIFHFLYIQDGLHGNTHYYISSQDETKC